MATAPKKKVEVKSKTKKVEVKTVAKKADGWPFQEKGGKKVETEKPEAKAVETRGRIGKFEGTMKIKILVPENPKRKNSAAAARYELYRNSKTVADYQRLGGTIADVRWDAKQNYIAVE